MFSGDCKVTVNVNCVNVCVCVYAFLDQANQK